MHFFLLYIEDMLGKQPTNANLVEPDDHHTHEASLSPTEENSHLVRVTQYGSSSKALMPNMWLQQIANLIGQTIERRLTTT